jgi:hypothetical protein
MTIIDINYFIGTLFIIFLYYYITKSSPIIIYKGKSKKTESFCSNKMCYNNI